MADWIDDVVAALPAGLRRREFLDLVALLLALPACKREQAKPPPPSPEPAGALDATTRRTLDAVTGRILPGDGSFPDAREAGVITFIDRQLAIAPLAKLTPMIAALARALDDTARTRGAADFTALPAATQDELIDAWSRGKLGTKLPERELFRALHTFVLEGFLCDPKHGGNKDELGWRAIGFPEPTLRTPGEHHHG